MTTQTQVIILDQNIGEILANLVDELRDLKELMSSKNNEVVRKYYTIKQFVEFHPGLSKGGLEKLIFHSDKNGFNEVIRREGRKILIDSIAYDTWLKKQEYKGR